MKYFWKSKLIENFEHYIIKFPNSNDGLNIGKKNILLFDGKKKSKY